MAQTPNDYLERILTARVYDVAVESPLELAPNLSRRIGNQIYLKREDIQPVFSFKIRGAYNKMVKLTRAELDRGVVCASAGNHAQGVAFSAEYLDCRAIIVMPATAPQIKVDAVARRGAEVVLIGESYSDCYAHAIKLCEENGMTFVHPYDDPEVIAGQGTVGMEILMQHPDPLDAIFIPVGGGGLLAGVAAYIKRLRPEVKIIGVEPTDANAMYLSLKLGERVNLAQVGIFADGVAVKQVGEETFRLCRDLVDDVVLVDTDAMCAAIKDVFEDTRSILEPAGALAIAGAKLWAAREKQEGKTFVAIASGANMNFDRLRYVAEQAEMGEGREAIVAVTVPEEPGSFRNFCSLIGARNVTEFNYRYGADDQAHVFVGLSIQKRSEVTELIEKLAAHGLPAIDLTDNELAKLHIRHLVGGHAPQAQNERLLRFEFPERPGALLNFLQSMNVGWNISLFHYRNHGADYGRILVGIQVPAEDDDAFTAFLQKLGYPYWLESDNPAYQLFLGS
ncbi:threonine dehydratase [Andreprevotia lacus DSM 23236]|jgi:threonine dehydratase|uniref:L-threonine dehydratase n=1 Tax=Andreprevotia lacus DSM 23236 TaxID=1121001 RepID=A0A1W1XW57_9NEIS|nr:threonine ammonia-lyase, biosynthetic [Andreprevotia lacus]SMC28074.1 threonine dehydratase [Andreprevotia lacus DSM 23236]